MDEPKVLNNIVKTDMSDTIGHQPIKREATKPQEEIRKSGIDIIGDIPWGTHLCQFYKTQEDLLDILMPYFKAGLENNEFCMWVASEQLSEKEAEGALRIAVPDFDQYLQKGQIEIVSHNQWYLKDGVFGLQRVLNAWVDKLNQALAKGYDGIRVTGNTAWLEKKDWRNFADYEAAVNNAIGKYKMIAICPYSLDKCKSSEVIDVVSNHQFALIRKEGKWASLESSERKKVEEALWESEEFARRVIESSNDCIKILDLDGNLLSMSRGGQKLMEIDDITPYLNSSWVDFWKGMDREAALEAISKAKKGDVGIFHGYCETAKGSPKWWEIIISPIKDPHDNIVRLLSVSRDITECKKAEEKLLHSERMAAVGELAKGIAHEIRNPLGNISASAQFTLKKHKLDKQIKEQFKLILRNSESANKIVKELLDFTKPVELGFKSIQVDKIVDKACILAKARRYKQYIILQRKYPEKLPLVLANEKRLEEAFSNLILNAYDAMPKGGRLKIDIHSGHKNKEVVINFSDTGRGILKENLNKIFNPFFTTKAEGVGLGLTWAHQVINYHGGNIEVKSEVNKGTEITVRLPIHGGGGGKIPLEKKDPIRKKCIQNGVNGGF